MRKTKLPLAAGAVVIPGLAGMLIAVFVNQRQVIEVNNLWDMVYQGQDLEGRTFIVRGDAVFEPRFDYPFGGLYLIDSQTPPDQRTPGSASWFGISIADVTCTRSEAAAICQPFDPSRAAAFQFKGTVHLEQAGMRSVMWLSGVNLEQSCQLLDGKWQPITSGAFEIPIKVETVEPMN